MKFLLPVKFDVNRALTLYKTHEVSIKNGLMRDQERALRSLF